MNGGDGVNTGRRGRRSCAEAAEKRKTIKLSKKLEISEPSLDHPLSFFSATSAQLLRLLRPVLNSSLSER
jgi:hypothetical protein